MNKNIKLFFFFLLLTGNLKAQLKGENFIIPSNTNTNAIISNTTKEGNKFLNLHHTGFKYEDDLTLVYFNKGPGYCCNYYEVKKIPKEWNIITVKDIVAHMEDKSTGFRFNKKKLFFVEYDKDRRIYKAYQAEVIGWPRTD